MSQMCSPLLRLQTDTYLEELTDVVPEADSTTQTDAFLDRPPTPQFVAPKSGIDAATQIEKGKAPAEQANLSLHQKKTLWQPLTGMAFLLFCQQQRPNDAPQLLALYMSPADTHSSPEQVHTDCQKSQL